MAMSPKRLRPKRAAVTALPAGPYAAVSVEGQGFSNNTIPIMANCYDSANQYEWQSNDGSGWVFLSSSDAFDFTADLPFGPVSYRVRVTNAGVVSNWTVVNLGLIQYQIYGTLISEGCYTDPDYQCCSEFADGAGGSFGGCGGQNSFGTFSPQNWAISDQNFLVDGEPTSSGAQLIWPPIPVDEYGYTWWGGTAGTRKYVLTGPSGDIDLHRWSPCGDGRWHGDHSAARSKAPPGGCGPGQSVLTKGPKGLASPSGSR